MWSLAYGLWALAGLCAILAPYLTYSLWKRESGQMEGWTDRTVEAFRNPTSVALVVNASVLLILAAEYGFTIGFWIATGFLALLVLVWLSKRYRRRSDV